MDIMAKKFLGVVISPEYAACEGLLQVFDHLEAVRTDAIAVWPWLIEPVSPKEGARMPDLHIDGHRRVLDRPLWGKTELHVKAYPAYAPNPDLFGSLPYRPPEAAPETLDRELPQRMFVEAQRRNMAVHVGIAPLLPPGLRATDRPVRVDGVAVQPPYVAPAACINSPAAQGFALASIQDLLANYPQAGGLILDWAEFGAYLLEDHFTCFCEHCQRAAAKAGYDWEGVRRDVSAAWSRLHRLSPQKLRRFTALIQPPDAWSQILTRHSGWRQFLDFKAWSVERFFRRVRDMMDREGYATHALTARGWCSPWNLSSGLDYARLSAICSVVSPKLFTFDHAALPRWAGLRLQEWNPGLAEPEILAALVQAMNLPDAIVSRRFEDYRIPAPEEEHPTFFSAYQERLEGMAAAVQAPAHCYPISHPYLPAHQWRDMVALIRDSPVDGMWVNMYGYLSDEKLKILEEIWPLPRKVE